MNKKQITKQILMIFASAVAGAIPHAVPSLWWLEWIAFIPFCYICFTLAEHPRRTPPFAAGFLFAFVYHFCTYFWFIWLYPFDSVGFSRPVAAAVCALAWLGASAIHGIIYGLSLPVYALLSRPLRSRGWRASFLIKPFFFSAAWLLSESITFCGTLAFPWSRLSVTQAFFTPAIQSVSLFGSYFLSFLIIFTNSLAASAIECIRKKERASRRRAAVCISLGLSLFIANTAFGVIRMASGKPDGNAVSAAVIQGNIVSGDKWQEGRLTQILDTYMSMTEEAASSSPEWIIWPESAVPVNAALAPKILDAYKALSVSTGAELYIGSFMTNDYCDTNSIIQIQNGELSGTYSKRHLVPFGEYLPWKTFISFAMPSLAQINQYSDVLTPGADSGTLCYGTHRLGGAVCFDSIFPSLIRDAVNDGAEAIILVTNDSWYKDSPAVRQHLAQAALRAAENGRYIVRAANSGISAFISDKGEITSEIGALKRGILEGKVELISEKTLYSVIGDAFLYIVFLSAALIWAALIIRERIYEKRKKNI
ncbi:MAG: apolipoprotein N-acyltransferase [Oscillospiraceae bacterium]|nr:apolipoprotein N-acyltransferase [Oscillospiraceae bacterium]